MEASGKQAVAGGGSNQTGTTTSGGATMTATTTRTSKVGDTGGTSRLARKVEEKRMAAKGSGETGTSSGIKTGLSASRAEATSGSRRTGAGGETS